MAAESGAAGPLLGLRAASVPLPGPPAPSSPDWAPGPQALRPPAPLCPPAAGQEKGTCLLALARRPVSALSRAVSPQREDGPFPAVGSSKNLTLSGSKASGSLARGCCLLSAARPGSGWHCQKRLQAGHPVRAS